ncbi:hypothetical protein [Vulcanococcus limneticus]
MSPGILGLYSVFIGIQYSIVPMVAALVQGLAHRSEGSHGQQSGAH